MKVIKIFYPWGRERKCRAKNTP